MLFGVILDHYFFHVIGWSLCIFFGIGLIFWAGSKYPDKAEVASIIFFIISMAAVFIGMANSIATINRSNARYENHTP